VKRVRCLQECLGKDGKYFLNGPVLTHPPPGPGGIQFSPVGRA